MIIYQDDFVSRLAFGPRNRAKAGQRVDQLAEYGNHDGYIRAVDRRKFDANLGLGRTPIPVLIDQVSPCGIDAPVTTTRILIAKELQTERKEPRRNESFIHSSSTEMGKGRFSGAQGHRSLCSV